MKPNIEAFWRKVLDDPDLRARVDSIPFGNPQEIATHLSSLSSEAGFSTTPEEFLAEAPSRELNERDLGCAVGGALSANSLSENSMSMNSLGANSLGTNSLSENSLSTNALPWHFLAPYLRPKKP